MNKTETSPVVGKLTVQRCGQPLDNYNLAWERLWQEKCRVLQEHIGRKNNLNTGSQKAF